MVFFTTVLIVLRCDCLKESLNNKVRNMHMCVNYIIWGKVEKHFLLLVIYMVASIPLWVLPRKLHPFSIVLSHVFQGRSVREPLWHSQQWNCRPILGDPFTVTSAFSITYLLVLGPTWTQLLLWDCSSRYTVNATETSVQQYNSSQTERIHKGVPTGEESIVRLRKSYCGTQTAIIRLPVVRMQNLLAVGKVRIRWVVYV